MMILVLVSILLAMVILYNLTNINVAERIRELSTIKVLGFHHQEVTLYIYRETILLSLVGIGLGLLGGFLSPSLFDRHDCPRCHSLLSAGGPWCLSLSYRWRHSDPS